MQLPPLLESRSERAQAALVLGGPILFGIICGILLGITEIGYLVLSLAGIGGGYFAGLEHDDVRQGLLRGLIGGALFGGSILFTNALIGSDAKAGLPDPPILLMVLTAVIGSGLGGLGARNRARRAPTA